MLNRRSSLTRRPLAKALRLLFVTALLALALGAAPAQHSRTAPAGLAGAVSPAGLLNPDGTLDLSSGFQGTLDLSGWEVTLDGERGPVLKPASRSSAAPVTAWNAMPKDGLNGAVYALAVLGSDLYVGGFFPQTRDGTLTNLGNIARYDTTAGTWHALDGQGLDSAVYALAVVGSNLYVGGAFSQTGDGTTLTDLNHIARYDTALGAWHALSDQGLDDSVRALAVVGSDLYVGGDFTESVDGATLRRIARYNTTASTWHALPNGGLNGAVLALAVVGSDLYVGGFFTQSGDTTVPNLNRIARYDIAATSWEALPGQGLNGWVYALAVLGSDLYVGGNFIQTGDGTTLKDLGNIARYDTTANTWHALDKQGLNGVVCALVMVGSDLYVGGLFTQTGDTTVINLNRIARYDTTAPSWNALFNQGLGNTVQALAVVGTDLYVGGEFTQTGDTLTNLSRIARYDTTALPRHALPNRGLDGVVWALAVVGTDLYVGGGFTQTGDGTTLTNLGNIARYDTTAGTWNALDGQGLDGWVRALAVVGSDLYVGGQFSQTGDGTTLTDLGGIARYDTTTRTWQALPNQGLDGPVLALAVVGSDLYVGGLFTQTGTGTVTHLGNIARYDTALDAWGDALPHQGLDDIVWTLAAVSSDLYVGGLFTQTGDTAQTLKRVARYDTTTHTWHTLPKQGLDDVVRALAAVGSDLYVGGDFTQTGDGTPLTDLGHIARYDTAGDTWHALPQQGLNDRVYALAVAGSNLYVGGYFTQTVDMTPTNLGRIARYDTTADIWHALPNQGLDALVQALAVAGSDLYVGGWFNRTGDWTATELGNIAHYDLPLHKLYLPLVLR